MAEIELQGHGSRYISRQSNSQSNGSQITFAGSLPPFLRNGESCCNDTPPQCSGSSFPSSSAMSASERLQNAESSQDIEYTVKQTAKVDREKLEDPRPSVWLSVVKWVVGIFLFVSVLTCLVASKISLLSIAYYHKDSSDNSSRKNRETIFIMVVVALMIPEAVTFLKACWTSLFRKSHKWPRTKAVLVVSYFYIRTVPLDPKEHGYFFAEIMVTYTDNCTTF